MGRYARPSCGSAEICPHAPVLPVYDHESFSHVSLPNSPGLGIVEDPQAFAGARRSHARSPFTFSRLRGLAPVSNAAPTITTSLTMVGVACRPTTRLLEIDLLVEVLL